MAEQLTLNQFVGGSSPPGLTRISRSYRPGDRTMSPTRDLPHGVDASSVTPFARDGSIDFAKIGPYVDWLIAEGVAGISPLGSSGEFFALESADRKRVVEATLEATAGRVATMVGTHHYSTGSRSTCRDMPSARARTRS